MTQPAPLPNGSLAIAVLGIVAIVGLALFVILGVDTVVHGW